MKNNFFTYVTSFFVGAAAGAVVALLNSPQSGKKTRAQLRNGISDARARTRKVITKARTRTLKRFDDIQDLVNGVSDEAIQRAEKIKNVSRMVVAKPKAILDRYAH